MQLVSYPDFGVYIYRIDRVYLLIRCGTIGQNGFGGHAHNDQLSFELWVDGLPIIVDPGTCIYTANPSLRNEMRSTKMHNTVHCYDGDQFTIIKWHGAFILS